jgi:hypothetical protein
LPKNCTKRTINREPQTYLKRIIRKGEKKDKTKTTIFKIKEGRLLKNKKHGLDYWAFSELCFFFVEFSPGALNCDNEEAEIFSMEMATVGEAVRP